MRIDGKCTSLAAPDKKTTSIRFKPSQHIGNTQTAPLEEMDAVAEDAKVEVAHCKKSNVRSWKRVECDSCAVNDPISSYHLQTETNSKEARRNQEEIKPATEK